MAIKIKTIKLGTANGWDVEAYFCSDGTVLIGTCDFGGWVSITQEQFRTLVTVGSAVLAKLDGAK